MSVGLTTDRSTVDISEMRQIHQIVHHQHVVGLDVEYIPSVRPLVRKIKIGEIDDFRLISQRWITHPDPDNSLALNHRIAFDVCRGWDRVLTRNLDTVAGPIKGQSVIPALQAIFHDFAMSQRRTAMTTAVL